MHISSIHLWTYDPNTLISGNVEITHDNVTTRLNISELDRHRIQDIVVNAFLAEREHIAHTILNNSPAFVALEPPKNEIEEAEYVPIIDKDESF